MDSLISTLHYVDYLWLLGTFIYTAVFKINLVIYMVLMWLHVDSIISTKTQVTLKPEVIGRISKFFGRKLFATKEWFSFY